MNASTNVLASQEIVEENESEDVLRENYREVTEKTNTNVDHHKTNSTTSTTPNLGTTASESVASNSEKKSEKARVNFYHW